MTGTVDGFAHFGDTAVEVRDDLYVLPAEVLLAGEQTGVVLALAARVI